MGSKLGTVTTLRRTQEMYTKTVRASEAVINILAEAQRECEEMYLQATEPILDEIMGEFERRGEDDPFFVRN